MPGNSFGVLFRVTTFGESHGPVVGAVVDGCPPGIELDESDVQAMLDRRRPGGAPSSTKRKEKDKVSILSGLFKGKTTGTPILLLVENRDADSTAYHPFADLFRPGHGDYTYHKKYGIRDWRGGGRASARETVGRVAAGAIAKILLKRHGIDVYAFTRAMGYIEAREFDPSMISHNPYGFPDMNAAKQADRMVNEIRKKGDSVGGIVEIRAIGVPPGLGEPVFDKLDAELAKGLMSIGAVKGVEIGDGFAAAEKLGSENNDPILPDGFASNHAGGILAGISNGEEIIVRVAIKPIPSIGLPQQTVDINNRPQTITVKGRHDICAIPRINVVCEAMVAIVLADHFLRQKVIA